MIQLVWLISLTLSLEYIQIIMTLEESVQHVVMTAIQEVSTVHPNSNKCLLLLLCCYDESL